MHQRSDGAPVLAHAVQRGTESGGIGHVHGQVTRVGTCGLHGRQRGTHFAQRQHIGQLRVDVCGCGLDPLGLRTLQQRTLQARLIGQTTQRLGLVGQGRAAQQDDAWLLRLGQCNQARSGHATRPTRGHHHRRFADVVCSR